MEKKLLHSCMGAHARVVEIHIYIYICAYACIYIYMYMHICMHMYISIYPSIYVCLCVRMYIYVFVCMYLYMYIYMYMYKSICIFVQSMHAFAGVVEHHACAGVYVRKMLWISAYTFASRSLQDVHMRYVYTCVYAYVYVKNPRK